MAPAGRFYDQDDPDADAPPDEPGTPAGDAPGARGTRGGAPLPVFPRPAPPRRPPPPTADGGPPGARGPAPAPRAAPPPPPSRPPPSRPPPSRPEPHPPAPPDAPAPPGRRGASPLPPPPGAPGAPPRPAGARSRPSLEEKAARARTSREAARRSRIAARPPAVAGAARRSLGRDTGVLAAGTLLSRLTGFIRVVVAAAVLGVNGLTDAYNFANSVPNTIYDLLLGGVLSATLIPVFVDELRKDDAGEGSGGVAAILSTVTVVLVILSAGLYLFAPLVVRFYLLLSTNPLKGAELSVGTSLLRLFSPQVFFLGAIVVSTALLNARRRFAAASFSPVVNNLIAIAALVLTGVIARSVALGPFRHEHTGLVILGLGTTLGYVVQLVVQLPAMHRAGLSLRPVWAPRHPAVRRVVGLSTWLVGVVVANQVSYNLVVVIADKRSGDFTVYQLAYQFFQLPYALFAVSIASAIMPDLAERWSDRDHIAFLRRVILGLRSTFALLLPAAVGYALVAQPAIVLAVRHGLVRPSSAHEIGVTLAVFALGLPGFSVFLPLVRGLQAMKDTRTMFLVYGLENLLTVVLAFPLFSAFGDPGLAFAWVAPYTVASIVTAAFLHRRVGPLGGVYTGRILWRTSAATLGMGVVVFLLGRVLPAGAGDLVLAFRLVVQVGAGLGVYLLLARSFGIPEVDLVLRPAAGALRRIGARRAPAVAGRSR